LTNVSIFDVQNLSPPIPQRIRPSDLLSAFTFILGDDHEAGQLADPNSTFSGYLQKVVTAFDTAIEGTLCFVLSDLLTLPFIVFQPTLVNVADPQYNISQFNVTVELAQSHILATIPAGSVIIYKAVSIFALIWGFLLFNFGIVCGKPPPLEFRSH
jgi:hypothetical protein